MKNRKLSRRTFLRASAVTAASLVAAGCAAPATEAPPPAAEPTATPKPAEPTATPVPPEPEAVTLEMVTNLGEYENGYRQLLDIYEAQNPGVTINLSSFNEDTEAAFLTKVAGGYLPAIEKIPENSGRTVGRGNYQEFVNLSEIDFPWFDRWTYDVKNTWADRYGLPGPRTLDVFQGIVASMVYHRDIMEKAGWDPQKDIKTLDDFEGFLDDLVKFVEAEPDMDFAWDRAWVNGFMYFRYFNLVPVAFPDGQRDRQWDCWMGEAKFNAEDSPYRHVFEFDKKALEKGWHPDAWWNRTWEADMEATFIAKRTPMVIHGPWIWDKVLANDPSAELAGFPFPSVDGKKTVLHVESPGTDFSWCIRAGNEDTPYWEVTKDLFAFWFSPPNVEGLAELEGRGLVYELDEPLELNVPQFTGLLNYVGKDFFSHVVMDNGPWGEQDAAAYLESGGPTPWDRFTGGFNPTFVDAISGKISIQEALDIAQANWDKSYEGLPLV